MTFSYLTNVMHYVTNFLVVTCVSYVTNFLVVMRHIYVIA